MHIFIDESGNFIPSTTSQVSVSTIGALIVRDQKIDDLNRLYSRLRKKLPKEKGEVKGRLLSELQVQEVCKILKRLGCIFEVVATDLNQQSQKEIAEHVANQTKMLTQQITKEHKPELVKNVKTLQRELNKMSPQLYVQSVGLTTLIYEILQKTSLYFSLRFPKELGAYHWTIDAKGNVGKTSWEEWWMSVIMPFLESTALKKKFVVAEHGDYSAYDRFRVEATEYKVRVLGISPTEKHLGMNKIMREDIRFSSKAEYGLELVDILTNTIRRSMSGNFQRHGWLGIRELMVAFKSPIYIKMYTLGSHGHVAPETPYFDFLNDFSMGGKQILRPSDLPQISAVDV